MGIGQMRGIFELRGLQDLTMEVVSKKVKVRITEVRVSSEGRERR